MNTRAHFSWGLVAILMLLAGCGLSAGNGQNTSPPTHSSGPVEISTDHSQYGAAETLNVTVTNHLATPIYAFDTRASCSILGLEFLAKGGWQVSSAARCALGRMALPVKIEPGATYSAKIASRSIPNSKANFPAGTYRLSLTYYSSLPNQGAASAGTTNYSVQVTVTSSGSSSNSVPSGSAPGGTGPSKP